MNEQWNTAPYLFVSDIQQAANYYKEKLGFSFSQYWGDPPSFVMMYRGGITIMLSLLPLSDKYPDMLQPNRKRDHHAWDAYIWIGKQDIEALYQEFVNNGVTIASKPTKKDYYGMYEMEVMDPFGYVLCFAQDIVDSKQSD
ncbi:MAG: VOC family protein [Candidatus Heimdallarchaeota archaeon]|nr:VOC family protein [Candidatus Heimdallarchaeota archaeon]